MRLPVALGVALAALSMAAYAQPQQQQTRVIVRHGGGGEFNPDTNNDGWLTRQEASAAADHAFAQMDTNNDGRLTAEDRPHFEDIDVEVEAPEAEAGDHAGHRVRVIHRDHDEHGGATEEHEERVERTITIVRTDDGGEHVVETDGAPPVPPVPPAPGIAPVPPVPPHPPMFMMIFANSEEADLNGDGALSREEFRNQHLRFFDASDVNNDGRIRFEPPPAPPEPPAPPAPPEPPRAPRR